MYRKDIGRIMENGDCVSDGLLMFRAERRQVADGLWMCSRERRQCIGRK
jgi:hypothetical protein